MLGSLWAATLSPHHLPTMFAYRHEEEWESPSFPAAFLHRERRPPMLIYWDTQKACFVEKENGC